MTYDPKNIKVVIGGVDFGSQDETRVFRYAPEGEAGRIIGRPQTIQPLRHSFYENGHAWQTCVACGAGLADANGECKPFTTRTLR